MLEESRGEGDARRRARRLAAATFVLLALTTALIVLGALVRAHGAGLACPDWPLCFGELVPRMDFRVAFEWTHRLVAGTVGLAFLGLGVALLRQPTLRRRAGALWAAGAALLAVQVLLGALTVWHLLAEWTVTSHLLTGNAFNATLLLLGLRLRELAAPRPDVAVRPPLRAAVGAAAALLVAQLVLGGLVSSSYAGLVCPDWPACRAGVFFPTWEGALGLHLAHRWNAVLLLAALVGAALLGRGRGALGTLLAAAAALGAAQVAVGVANVLLRLPVEVTALHSALAAVLVLLLAAAVREAWLPVASRAPERRATTPARRRS